VCLVNVSDKLADHSLVYDERHQPGMPKKTAEAVIPTLPSIFTFTFSIFLSLPSYDFLKNCSSLYSFKRYLKSHLIAQRHLATARASDSCLMLDYMRVINFRIIIIIIICLLNFYRHFTASTQ